MQYILTSKYQHSKKCKDGKNRHFILFFLNGIKILKQKRPFNEHLENGANGMWFYKNTFLLNGNLYQTRYNESKCRNVKYPISKKILIQFEIPANYKINLSECKI